ncbi:HypC/HybG/HupF family hydrogenase formation chaperone [Rahnella sp. C60]|uniref:HypC/HybG/HupF family hydrogenase formation chaperone n=1 Tax=Rahnella perminowiae TaxID=2816244 RepID=A0ABS6L4R3_9GAMM|nr:MULTISPECIES: HypC/HybG/HupF family hydrogenase formation chaperone [Rahnella]UJD88387.1 HypC/HybG/HupF family hydrogenase formation chaperone [Rahnella aquatilis]MBU9811832.1 HypC/HybG/HupF family hydrogenase formation chaperone [Rahnella perminowiae]MBU9813720.1 HypC/HybG/HupF family hydrogenase formation chaperone [Rahnella perminowiae]MBU9827023.1 HypC/HybG/HupF family hydrogenase formation chaperone [Rahnella perminowiae]MBU9836844.1 HypC/HybG/HupF family hydrogenase formation chaperon
MCIGIPGQIVALHDQQPDHAWAEVCGLRREVNIALVCDGQPQMLIGGWVLIHVGFALSKLDEQEAQETLAALHAMEEVEADVALFLGAGEAK